MWTSDYIQTLEAYDPNTGEYMEACPTMVLFQSLYFEPEDEASAASLCSSKSVLDIMSPDDTVGNLTPVSPNEDHCLMESRCCEWWKPLRLMWPLHITLQKAGFWVGCTLLFQSWRVIQSHSSNQAETSLHPCLLKRNTLPPSYPTMRSHWAMKGDLQWLSRNWGKSFKAHDMLGKISCICWLLKGWALPFGDLI